MHEIIILALLYLAFHLGHAHSRWRQSRHLPWPRRVWISIPGPFGTRISRKL
jgi:hypothetical protein